MVERADPFLLIASLASRGADAGLLEQQRHIRCAAWRAYPPNSPPELRARVTERVWPISPKARPRHCRRAIRDGGRSSTSPPA